MPQPSETHRPGRSETREAAALRENLRRRKQQARARTPQLGEPEPSARSPAGLPEPACQDNAGRSTPCLPVDAEEAHHAGAAR